MCSLKNKTKAELVEEIELLRNKIEHFNIRNQKQVITDKSIKKSDSALRESEEKFHTISDQSMMAILIIQNDRYQYLNQAYSEITGYSIKESLEWGTKEWAKIIHPDNRAQSLEQESKKQKSHKNMLPSSSYRIITKSGELKWIDLFSKTIIFNNRTAILATFIDITERKKAEEQLNKIFDNTQDAILIHDLDGKILDVNKKMCSMYGVTKQEAMSLAIRDISSSGMKTEILSDIWESVLKGEQFLFEWEAIRPKDKTVFHVEVSLQRINFDENDIVLANIRDKTKRKAVEENINQRLRFEKIISSISSRFVGVFDIDDAINAALCDMSKLSGAARVYLFLFDKDGEKMDNTHEWCAKGVTPEKDNLKNIPLKMFPWRMSKLNKGENIHIPDISKMPEEAKLEKEILEAHDIKAILILPLYIRKKLSGFIGFDNVSKTVEWADDDITLLQISTELIGNALERKWTEEEISQSGDFLNSVINGIADPIVVKDENHRWIAINNSFCEMVGSTRDEILGKSDYDLFPKEQADVFWTHDNMVLSSEKVDINEEEITGAEGKRIISTIKSSFTNPATGKRNLVGTIRDITERKKAEIALKESEARLSTLMSNLPGMAYQCKNDEHWTMVFVNEACEQLTGYKPDQLIYNKDISYNELIHPDDRDFVRRHVKEAFNNGDHFELEYRIISGEGKEKWVWERGVQTTSFEVDQKLIEGVIHDITRNKLAENKLKVSEEYYRALIENSNDVISILDEKGNVIYGSTSHQKVLGYLTGELVGENVFEFVHPDDRDLISRQFGELLQKPGEIENFHMRFLHKDGTWRNIEGAGRNLLNTSAVKGIVVNYRDITKRVQTEEELWKSREIYRITSEKTGQLIYNYETNTTKIYWTGAIELVTGYSPEEFQLVDVNDWTNMIHPDDRKMKMTTLDDAEKKCSNYIVDYRFLHKNGFYIYVEDHGVFLPGEDGKANRMMGSMNDITERREAEKALRESEEKFKEIVTNTEEILFMIDSNGIFTLSEGRGLAALGLSPGQLVGKSSFEVYKEFPDVVRGIKYGLLGEKYTDVVNIGDVYFNVKYSPRKDSLGNIIGILGMAINISEKIIAERNLEDSEKRLRFVIESATDSIISIDDKGIIINWNNAAINMFGYSYEETIGKHVNIILPERFINDHSKRISNAKKSKQYRVINKGSIELIGLRKDGSEFPIELSLSTWNIGKTQYFTAIIRDITERQKNEQELEIYKDNLEQLVQERTREIEQVNKQLKSEIDKKNEAEKRVMNALKKEKQVNELKTRFISTVSHEIRTPLTTIKSSAELLKRYGKRLEVHEKDEQLSRIVNSVDYLIVLLEDVLMMSRTDSGKIIFSPKEVNLIELVKEVIDKIESVDNKEHKFSFSFKGINKNVLTDSKLLGITVTNLINNAVKYSPDKSKIQINVSFNDLIIIEVIDQGIGIPEEGKELLFEPFYRASNAEKYNGSGLGLSIVKRSVELLKGTIAVESKINEGSKFIVKIPINNLNVGTDDKKVLIVF